MNRAIFSLGTGILGFSSFAVLGCDCLGRGWVLALGLQRFQSGTAGNIRQFRCCDGKHGTAQPPSVGNLRASREWTLRHPRRAPPAIPRRTHRIPTAGVTELPANSKLIVCRQCPDPEVRKHLPQPLSELRDRKGHTSNIMILVPLLNPKFATVPAAKSCEFRVRGTSRPCAGGGSKIPSVSKSVSIPLEEWRGHGPCHG